VADKTRERLSTSRAVANRVAYTEDVRATGSTNLQMLEDYPEKKWTMRTRARRFVQTVR
jgi:hypothetical protein